MNLYPYWKDLFWYGTNSFLIWMNIFHMGIHLFWYGMFPPPLVIGLNPFHRKMTFTERWHSCQSGYRNIFLDLVISSYFTLFTPEYWKCGALWTRAASDHDEQIPASQPIISRGRHETLTPCTQLGSHRDGQFGDSCTFTATISSDHCISTVLKLGWLQ